MNISEKAKDYALRRYSELTLMEALDFNGSEIKKAYREGMKEAFQMIKHEIDDCIVYRQNHTISHIRFFIDKILEIK